MPLRFHLIRRVAAVTALALAPLAPPSAAQTGAPGEVVTITMAGDTGFAPNHAPVRADGVVRHGEFLPWEVTTEEIAPLIDGDLNFVNIETIITDQNNLPRDLKNQRRPFSFRTHPNGARHLVDIGFNLFSLANNHSMDYGVEGLQETLRHVEALRGAGLLAATGLGQNRIEAATPEVVTVGAAEIAFASIGIVTNNLGRHRAGENRPGQIAYRFEADYDLSLDLLAQTAADYRILSIHYGIEGRVRTDARQIRDWRERAAMSGGVDLIIGHHAHVPRAVEIANGAVIFYGLGNFLHHGTANISQKGVCKDFGVFARVHALRGEDGRLRARAIEAVPVGNTHRRTTALTGERGAARIHALNYLAQTLPAGGEGVEGVRFTPQADGSGLYCFPGAERDPGRIGALCAGYTPAPSIPQGLLGRIRRSCAR